MMLKVRFFLLIVPFLWITDLLGQEQQTYVAVDTFTHVGLKLKRGLPKTNAKLIRVRNETGQEIYYPEQIKEFRLLNGVVFISKNIEVNGESKQVFLETLSAGRLTLYRYAGKKGNRYFIKASKDGELLEVFKGLKELDRYKGGNDFFDQGLEVAYFNPKSLKKLAKHYNQPRKQPFQFFRIGVTYGFSNSNISIPNELSNLLEGITFETSNSSNIGLFAEVPFLISPVTINAGITFLENAYVSSATNSESDIDAVLDMSSLRLPVLVRYSPMVGDLRVFAQTGLTFSYDFSYFSTVRRAEKSSSTITTLRPITTPLTSRFISGGTLGAGLMYFISRRKVLSVEMRNNWFFERQAKVGQRTFDLLIGLSL